jgi:PAS domain S-box-containing protein
MSRSPTGAAWALVALCVIAGSELVAARLHTAVGAPLRALILVALAALFTLWVRRDHAAADRVERALREERDALADRYRMLSQYSNDIVMFVHPDGRILDANDRAVAAYGYDRAALLALTIAELRAPDSRPLIAKQLEEARTSGAIRFDTTHRRRDGSEFPVEVSTRACDVGGRTLLVSIVRDITERRDADLRLRDSEESFRTTLRSIGDGVVTTDERGRVTGLNPVAEALMGWSAAEVRGRPLDEVFRIVNETTRLPVESPVARVLREGVVVGLANHTALIRPDGSEIPIADSGAPIRGDDGRVRGVVLVFRDATEERHVQQALEAQAKLFRSVSDAVVSLGPDWTIQDWNPAAQHVYDYAAAEVVGKAPAFLGTEFPEGTEPEFRARLDADGQARVEVRQYRRDGARLWVELSAAVLRDGDGVSEGYVVAGRDVTDRKRAELEARASETKFRTAFRQASFGILIVDGDGRIIEANRSIHEQLRYPEGELLGRPVFDLVHADDRGRSVRMVGELARGERDGFRDERRYLRKDGTVAYANLRLNAVRDDDGTFRFVIGLVEDVTELKNLHAQLLFSDRMASVGTLAAGVAHEINNPLAFVTANVAWVREELSRTEPDLTDVRAALAEVAEGAQRVRDIVRDLKIFSREDPSAPTVTDVGSAIRSAVSLAQSEVRHRAALQLALEEGLRVVGSPHRIAQVFLNLIVNAAQSIVPGHVSDNRIAIAARRASDTHVLVEVTDTGAGIPHDVLPRIFEPFFTTKAVGEGTGLGLAICHGIVASVDGRIEVESELGRGTTFRVHLGCAPADEPAPRPSRTVASSARARVLVVDDEAFVRSSLVRLLGRDHSVEVVPGGREALEVLARERFDVVLCDLMMPEMTGMELHQRLHALDPELAQRTVFLTGGAFAPEAEEFVRATRNVVLEKPFDEGGVAAAIAEALRRAPSAA